MHMSAFLTIAVIHFLAVISPGPDFAMVMKNSLSYSRKAAISTAAGLGSGMLVHAFYCLMGIGLLISQSIVLFNIIKFIGAAYLIYIGWKSMTSNTPSTVDQSIAKHTDISMWKGFRIGFLCNVLNPKATLFMFALFTQVIDIQTPMLIQALYGLYVGTATFIWFAFLASVLSLQVIRNGVRRIQHALERVMGVILIALGLKVALAGRE